MIAISWNDSPLCSTQCGFLSIFWHFTGGLCTCPRFPQGGLHRADVGEFGDFIGTFSTNLSPCGGKMPGVRFVISLGKFRTAGEYLRTKKVEIFTWTFIVSSIQLRAKGIVFRSGKWTVTIDCSRVLSSVQTEFTERILKFSPDWTYTVIRVTYFWAPCEVFKKTKIKFSFSHQNVKSWVFAKCSKNENEVLKCVPLGGLASPNSRAFNPPPVGKYENFEIPAISKVPKSARGSWWQVHYETLTSSMQKERFLEHLKVCFA